MISAQSERGLHEIEPHLDGRRVAALKALRRLKSLQMCLMLTTIGCSLSGCGVNIDKQSSSSNQPISQHPSIASIIPGTVTAGSNQVITLIGTGFGAGSTVKVSEEPGKNPVSVSNLHVASPTSIVFTATIPPDYTGLAVVQVRNEKPNSLSSSATLVIVSPSSQAAPSLPIFDTSAYHASGSSLIYHCSGDAGSYTITCDDYALDFTPEEGIRIVSAGPPEVHPAFSEQPVIAKQGRIAQGSHTYCYIAYVADALSGISAPSPQICLSDEPDLALHGMYNTLQGAYRIPLARFLWYVSEDDGPFQLFNVSSNSEAEGGAQDLGQRLDSRGGWPVSFRIGSQDSVSKHEDLFSKVVAVSGNQIALQDPLASSVVDVEVDHDDTGSIQDAINAAVSAGGGVIELGNGTFNVRRPTFGCFKSVSCPTGYTTDIKLKPSWYGYTNLYLDHHSPGNIFLKGNSTLTVIQTPPDSAGDGEFIEMGYGVPASAPYTAIKIEQVNKGDTSVTLANDSGLSTLHPGDDVWLYTGSFGGGSCVDKDGTPGGNCHFSEINTIKSISGRVISLAYPTSQKFYDDGVSSFGLVKMPMSPHNVGLSNFTINTYSPVVSLGMVFGLTVDHVTVNGFTSHGAFLGGMKRDMLIENSSWGIGAGNASWEGTEELDQCIKVSFINDTITGYAAPGAEGPSMGARIYLTEGTSQALFEHNKFDHIAILSQDTTDDIIDSNVFNDATVAIGNRYNEFTYALGYGSLRDPSVFSFRSQADAQITNNIFTIDSGYYPPWIIVLGHFTSGSITNNVITSNTLNPLAAINSGGGDIKNNVIHIGPRSKLTYGIAAIPDEAPGIPVSSFTIRGNQINAQAVPAGIAVMDSGFTDIAPVCIANNSITIVSGKSVSVSKSATNLSCDGTD